MATNQMVLVHVFGSCLLFHLTYRTGGILFIGSLGRCFAGTQVHLKVMTDQHFYSRERFELLISIVTFVACFQLWMSFGAPFVSLFYATVS